MIIHSSKLNKSSINLKPVKKVETIEDNQQMINKINPKKKSNKKTISTPIVVEESIVEDVKIVEEEKIDLSKWLEEDIDE